MAGGSFHETFYGEDRSAKDRQAFVLLEIHEVLDVERRQGNVTDKAAGGDPAVVGRARSAAELGVGLDLARRVATWRS